MKAFLITMLALWGFGIFKALKRLGWADYPVIKKDDRGDDVVFVVIGAALFAWAAYLCSTL